MDLQSNRIPLRPHHLVCLQYFIGKGYNKAFTLKTTSIVAYLKQHPSLACIQIVKGPDVLCRECPNLQSGCNQAIQCDQSYLQAFHFAIGSYVCYGEVTQKILTGLNDALFYQICHTCKWYALCSSLRKTTPSGNF